MLLSQLFHERNESCCSYSLAFCTKALHAKAIHVDECFDRCNDNFKFNIDYPFEHSSNSIYSSNMINNHIFLHSLNSLFAIKVAKMKFIEDYYPIVSFIYSNIFAMGYIIAQTDIHLSKFVFDPLIQSLFFLIRYYKFSLIHLMKMHKMVLKYKYNCV